MPKLNLIFESCLTQAQTCVIILSCISDANQIIRKVRYQFHFNKYSGRRKFKFVLISIFTKNLLLHRFPSEVFRNFCISFQTSL